MAAPISINTGIMQVLLSPLLWIVIIFFVFVFAFGGLWLRKQKKLQYPTLILTNLGNGKMGIEMTKSGWFKSKMFLKLLDYSGEENLKTKDGRKVQCGSSVDFHEIRGKRGLVCRRKDDDPKILVPLSRMQVENNELLAQIANADLRDASVQIIRQAEAETRSKWEQVVQWLIMGGILIFAMVSIIMVIQFTKQAQSAAWDRTLEAVKIVQERQAIPSEVAP